MRSFGKICGIIVLITLLSVSVVMAVGYEKYDSSGNPISKTDNDSKQGQSISSAIEKATFAKKYPKIIDDVTVYIRDVLSQFGLTENKTQ
ncbi:MAG: hypothetical protein ACLPVO_01220 [Desulfomonilaceae bacterium]|jgi:hypothetical protein